MEESIKIIEEIKKIKAGTPFGNVQRVTLKNELINLLGEGERIRFLGNYVVVLNPKAKFKRFPNGTISIYTDESYKRMIEWKEENNA